jgi:glycosyltransferase involved in cell wall biosynthesis
MTVPQAREAGQFGFEKFSNSEIAKAIQVQSAVLDNASHVFAMSEWAAESLFRDYRVPQTKVSVIYTGPNIELSAQVPDTPEADSAKTILFVGYDWGRKGGPILLESFRRVRQVVPDARLIVVGPDPGIREEGIQIVGVLDRNKKDGYAKLRDLYGAASCFCLPSIFDPFPIAIVDAMTAGTPVVAFDSGSRGEAVAHGETGFLVPLGGVVELSDALISLLNSTALQQSMKKAARKRAEALFTWPRVLERIGPSVAQSLYDHAEF